MNLANVRHPRVGIGFDVHRLVVGCRLVLGGVTVPYEKGLEGHSDGDALLHAVTDALLGAVSAGDIGTMFPSEDERWAGASSEIFLAGALEAVRQRGYRPVQLDSIIMAERPRLSSHLDEMKANLAKILGLSVQDVAVKATTCDRLGFVGRAEGIAAQAVVTVMPLTDATDE